MRLLIGILLVAACGVHACGPENVRPKPGDVKEFVADPIPSSRSFDYFRDFKVTQYDFAGILEAYFEVDEERWKHLYSHVAFGDRTGHVILSDGRKIKWMVKPAGLAWLEFPSGQKMFLAGSADEPTKADREPDLVLARLISVRDPRTRSPRLDLRFETTDKERREILITFRLGLGLTPHTQTLRAVIEACYPDGIPMEFTAPSMEALFRIPRNGIGVDEKGIEHCYLVSLKALKGK